MKKAKVVLPREHGGWAMISVPYIIGMMAAQPVLLHLPLFLAWLLLYLASYPLLQALRRGSKKKSWLKWGFGYAASAAAFLIPVVLLEPWVLGFAPVLLAFITVHIWHVRRKTERALFNDICAILLFCTGGAAAYFLGGGGFDNGLTAVVLFNFLYFTGTVFFVKSVFRERKNRRYTYYSKIYHVVILAVPLLCGNPWMSLAYLFPLLRAYKFSGTTMKPMKVGILEIIGAVQFLIVAVAIFLTI
ncbi:YwiC-like family protein [Shouchella clausii]